MNIPPDKWKHFFAGLVIGAVSQAFLSFLLNGHQGLSILLTLVLCFVIGYGFELYSKITGKGHYEFMDAVAVLIGAVPGIGSVALIQLLWT